MRWRAFLCGALLTLSTPLAIEAQQIGKVYRIGVLGLNLTPEVMGALLQGPEGRAFMHAMREMGWVEGQNFVFELGSATARALGLTIPPSLLARADQVIE